MSPSPSPSRRDRDSENQNGVSTSSQDGDQLGSATLLSSIANLTNTIIGTGMLATPHSFAYTGLLLGIILILFCGFTASLGLYLLTRCAAKIGGRKSSFNNITKRSLPSMARWFDAAIALKCYGVSISYLIICGQVMPQVIISFFKAFHRDTHQIPEFLLDRAFWILILMLVLIPLCFLRRLDSLRHTSYLSLLAVLFLVLIVIYYALFPSASKSLPPNSKGEISFFKFDYHLIAIFPVFVFAYTCAQNVFPVYNELWDNSEEKVNSVIGGAISSGGVIYLIVGILGYLTFGSKTPDNIITNYPSDSLFVCIGRVSIVILTLFSYPLQIHPCRASLDKVLSFSSSQPEEIQTQMDSESLLRDLDDDEEERLGEIGIGGVAANGERNGKANRRVQARRKREKDIDEMPLWKWCTLTCFLLTTTFIISLLIEDLSIILGFVGSIGSTTISFILPGILYATSHWDEPNNKLRKPAVALACWGVLVMITAVTANIWKLRNSNGGAGEGVIVIGRG